MEETKICKHCSKEKSISEYNKVGGGKWLQPYCKPCDKVRKDEHRHKNIGRYRERALQSYHRNKPKYTEEEKEANRQRSLRALIIAREKTIVNKMPPEEKKRRKSECDRKYRIANASKIKLNKKMYYSSRNGNEKAKEWQKKQMSDIGFVTKKRLRGRIYVALKRGVKSQSTIQLLGCSIEHFKSHFQSLFTEDMSWDKYMEGEIVIDHVKPCKLFNLSDTSQQRECFNYKNLQPLWKLDNLIKGISYEEKELIT